MSLNVDDSRSNPIPLVPAGDCEAPPTVPAHSTPPTVSAHSTPPTLPAHSALPTVHAHSNPPAPTAPKQAPVPPPKPTHHNSNTALQGEFVFVLSAFAPKRQL